MKKPIFFLVLFYSSLISFSQKEITNESHPFQVLFVEEVTIFGREVKQYDYLTNSDLLNIKGSITIFRYDSKVFTLNAGKYWVDELIKEIPEDHSYRTVLNPTGEYKNAYSPVGRSTCPSFNRIELVIPNEENRDFYREEVIELGWVFTKEEDYKLDQSFYVEFRNLYNNVIRTVKVNETSLSFRSDTLDLNLKDTFNLDHGFLTISIRSKHNGNFNTGDFGFILHDLGKELLGEKSDEHFIGLREAIYFDYVDDDRRANFLYRQQVRNSNQDPRFIKLYEDFLERNPEFKESSE